jgi:hypothetical protein
MASALPECLALIADTPLFGARVARELATLFEACGKPGTVVGDWHRVHLERDPDLCRRPQDRLTLRRAGKAEPERHHRELLWPSARRAVERDAVPVLESRTPASAVLSGYDVQIKGRTLGANPVAYGRHIECNGQASKQL